MWQFRINFSRYLEISNSYPARTEFFYKTRVASKTNNYWKTFRHQQKPKEKTVLVMESIKVTKNTSNKVVHQSSKGKGNPNNEHIRNTDNDSNNNMR